MTAAHARTFGLTAIAVLLLALAGALALDTWCGRLDFPGFVPFGVPRALAVRVLGSAVAALLSIVAVGMWRRRRAAWVATMLLVGALMVLELRWYARGTPRYLLMALSVLIVFYLNQREVQGLFRRGAAPPA
ncbi:MAG TPA: hypothetical protein VFS33_01390 [Gemmatimonadales bacterium]|nr:hypothetical protein [Gemmatimonadales bacterium]